MLVGYPTVVLHTATQDFTAQAPSDYVATNLDLVFPPGVTNAQFSIVTRADTECEGTEYVGLPRIMTSGGVIIVLGGDSLGPLAILDGPAAPVVVLSGVRLTGESLSHTNGKCASVPSSTKAQSWQSASP